MAHGDEYQRSITEAVARISRARSAIDQTTGMVMLIYGVGADDAFELLRSQARRTNSNLQALAQQFRDDVARLDDRGSLPSHEVLDQLLRTAHQRLPARVAPSSRSRNQPRP